MISFGAYAQQKVDDVDYKYNRVFLEGLIEEQIDAFRESKNLPSFKQDDVLSLAAEDQTNFIVRTKRAQIKKQKKMKQNQKEKQQNFMTDFFQNNVSFLHIFWQD